MKVGNTRRSHAMALAGVLAGASCGVTQQAQAQSVSTSISVYGLIDTMVRYSDNNRGDERLAEQIGRAHV